MRDGSFPSSGSGTSRSGERRTDDEGDRWPHRRRELAALGAGVRELRARRGLSQEQLGFRAGLHRNYVGAIERGEQDVTVRVLLKLARGLAIDLSELVGLYERNRARPQRLPPVPPARRAREAARRARPDERPVRTEDGSS